MKPKIIKADTAGMIVSWYNGNDVYYLGDLYVTWHHNGGVVYKDKNAFDQMQGICYIPEFGFFDQYGIDNRVSKEMKEWQSQNKEYDTAYISDGAGGYTYNDIWDAFFNHIEKEWYDEQCAKYGESFMDAFIDKEIAYIFQELDWQSPETFMDEMEWDEDWEEFVKDRLDDPRLTDQQAKELGYK